MGLPQSVGWEAVIHHKMDAGTSHTYLPTLPQSKVSLASEQRSFTNNATRCVGLGGGTVEICFPSGSDLDLGPPHKQPLGWRMRPLAQASVGIVKKGQVG